MTSPAPLLLGIAAIAALLAAIAWHPQPLRGASAAASGYPAAILA